MEEFEEKKLEKSPQAPLLEYGLRVFFLMRRRNLQHRPSHVEFACLYLLVLSSDKLSLPLFTLVPLCHLNSLRNQPSPSSPDPCKFRTEHGSLLMPSISALAAPGSGLASSCNAFLLGSLLPLSTFPTTVLFTFVAELLYDILVRRSFSALLCKTLASAALLTTSKSINVTQKFSPSELYCLAHLLTYAAVWLSPISRLLGSSNVANLSPSTVGLMGLCSFSAAMFLVLCAASQSSSKLRLFPGSLSLTTAVLTVALLTFNMGYPANDPLTWIIKLLSEKRNAKHILYYALSSPILVSLVGLLSKKFGMKVAAKRKLYHAVSVILFVPTLTAGSADVTVLAVLVGVCCFLLLELLRYELYIHGLDDFVGKFWEEWVDDKVSRRRQQLIQKWCSPSFESLPSRGSILAVVLLIS